MNDNDNKENAMENALTLEQHNEVAQSIVGMAEFLGRGLDRMCARIAEREKQEREAAAKKLVTDKIWSAIEAAVKAAGGTIVRENSWTWAWAVFGDEEVDVSVEAQQRRGSWRSTPTGLHNVVVGDYGNRKTFPPTKSGHSYDKIAAELKARADHETAAKARRQSADVTRAASKEIADRVATLFDARYGRYKWSGTVAPSETRSDRVVVSLPSRSLTEAQATELLDLVARFATEDASGR